MITTVEDSARRLITKYRLRAVFVAMDRLNKSIDRRDLRARDFWAQVVGVIHDYQRSGELPASVARSVSRRPVSSPLPQVGEADEE
jgi:hypothetical protein